MHSAHTQNPGRAHTARAVHRSWALLPVQPTGRVHVARTASACLALAGRALVTTRPGSLPQLATSLRCRDIKAARIMSRHQISVATPMTLNRRPRSRHQKPGRDLLETTLCRDINFMSRHRFCPQWNFQVATPKSMSRPLTQSPMSRHQIHVATPFLPTKTDQVATSNRCRDLKLSFLGLT